MNEEPYKNKQNLKSLQDKSTLGSSDFSEKRKSKETVLDSSSILNLKERKKTVGKVEKHVKEEKAKKAFRRLTGWDDTESVSVSLRTIIGGDILAGRWFRRHLSFLLFLVFLAIIYVTNRYAYQKEMIDNRKLTLMLEDRRLRAVVATSNLTEYTRRSNISQQLTDTTLKSSPAPFFYIQAN